MLMDIRFPLQQGEIAVSINDYEPALPTLIFLHDALGSISTWKDFPRRLAQKAGCNYLIYDRMGHGQSSTNPDALNKKPDYLINEAKVLLHLLTALNIRNPILFGHSDGGSIAIIAASMRNDYIQGIVVEAAHTFVEDLTLINIQQAKSNYHHGILKGKLTKHHGAKADAVFFSWANTWLDDSFRDWDITDYLPGVSCPCLIIQGEMDEYGTLQQVEAIRSGVKGYARVAVIPKVGHAPHKEDVESLLKLTSDFIKDLS